MTIGIDAHCLEGHRTGAGRYLFNLLREWQYLKSSIRFILYFKKEIPDDISGSDLFEKKTLKADSNFLYMHWYLPRAAKRDKADILFCPSYQRPIFYSGRTALTIHDIIYQAHPEWYNWHSALEKVIFQWIFRRSAKKADMIFVPSSFTKQEIINYYRVPEKKIKITPCAVDKNFRMLEKNKQFRSRLAEIKKKYGLGDRYILYVGTIFERRFLPEIIKAFVGLEHPGVQFFIVGRDCTQRKIDRLIERANSEIHPLLPPPPLGGGRRRWGRTIKRLDYVDEKDLVYLYNGAELFIWLSSYEGFGFPPLEAMACGTPVITTKMTSLAEVVGESAILIEDPSNIEEIKKAMVSVLTKQELRTKLIESGLLQAKRFFWENCAEDTLRLLKELA